MAKNRMSDLRNHLFETLESLKDDEKPMDLDRARVVCDVAKNLIESAKVEVQFLKVIGAEKEGSGFFGRIEEDEERRLPAGQPRVLRAGGER
jgi:hypothetical protein